MPTYSYKCNDCESKYEVFQKSIKNEQLPVCPECSSENSKKLMTSSNFSGFSAVQKYSESVASPCASGMCGLN